MNRPEEVLWRPYPGQGAIPFQKHVSKVQRPVRTLVDKGRSLYASQFNPDQQAIMYTCIWFVQAELLLAGFFWDIVYTRCRFFGMHSSRQADWYQSSTTRYSRILDTTSANVPWQESPPCWRCCNPLLSILSHASAGRTRQNHLWPTVSCVASFVRSGLASKFSNFFYHSDDTQ